MNRRNALAALMTAAGAGDVLARASKELRAGHPAIGGDLSGLIHKGRPIGAGLGGQFLLLYFGTAYRVPNCQGDLMAIRAAAEDINGACRKKTITPVFVFPAQEQGDTRAPDNLSLYVEAAGSPFIGLTGPRAQVLEIARGYAARFSPDLNAHTRFVYLMSPEGRNLGIAPADVLPTLKPEDFIARIRQYGIALPECRI